MEIGKLKQVTRAEMSEDFEQDLIRFTKVFHRGVEDAIAENERLGLSEEDSATYPIREEFGAPLVSEGDS